MDYYRHYELALYDMMGFISEVTWGGHEKKCPLWSTGIENDPSCNCIQSVLARTRKLISARVDDNIRQGFSDEGDPVKELEAIRSELLDTHALLMGGRTEPVRDAAYRVMDHYLRLCKRERELESGHFSDC